MIIIMMIIFKVTVPIRLFLSFHNYSIVNSPLSYYGKIETSDNKKPNKRESTIGSRGTFLHSHLIQIFI